MSDGRERHSLLGVHQRLREAIMRGEIAAGETTTQVTLARDFDIGRTPLREALRMLQREGLVVSEPNRRVRIAELSSSDAEQLYVMRIALEAIAARATVPLLSSADFAELEGFMAQMDHYERAEDRHGLRAPHQAFHARLVGGLGPRVTATLGEFFDHAERYRLVYGGATPALWERRRAEHREILDAAIAGDVDGAVRSLVCHYARTVALIFAGLDPGHDLTELRATITLVAPGCEDALAPPVIAPPPARPRRRADSGA